MQVAVREAREEDVPAIVEIYNFSVRHSLAVFTETESSARDRMAWLLERRAAGYPVLVAVEDERVVGFASFGAFRPWPGYRFTVEHSVYVDEGHQGRGIGRSLMQSLFDAARALGKRTMIAGVEAGNLGSLSFHERLGFQRAGTLPAVGFKFGRFVDLTFLHKPLAQ